MQVINPAQNSVTNLLEEINCPLCSSNLNKVIASGKDYEYKTITETFHFKECINCGHLYLSPRPKISTASILYPPNYYTSSTKGNYGWRNKLLFWLQKIILTRRIKPILKILPKNATVLEIGFGDGSLLKAIRNFRSDLTLLGVDLKVPPDIKTKLEKEEIITYECAFEKFNKLSSGVDLIIMTQLIEHFWDLSSCVKKIAEILNPNGHVILTTPNGNGYDRQLFKSGAWGGYYWPRHFNIFTPKSIEKLFDSSNLRVKTIKQLVCPVQWGFSLKYLFDRKNINWGANLINPFNPFFLAIFTICDLIAIFLGLESSNMMCIFTKNQKLHLK